MILVCGDREWEDREAIKVTLKAFCDGIAWLINGGCVGVDTIAAEEGKKLGMGVITFDPPWKKLGLSAGPIRNRMMLDLKPGIVIGFHDEISVSKGTKDCLDEADRRGYPTFLWTHETKKIEAYRRGR